MCVGGGGGVGGWSNDSQKAEVIVSGTGMHLLRAYT